MENSCISDQGWRSETVSDGTSLVAREHDEAILTHKLKTPDTLINFLYRLERITEQHKRATVKGKCV